MFKTIDWKLDLGDRGVLAGGRWLWARAISWGLLLFAGALILFFASFRLSDWIELPKGSDYWSAALLPLAGLAGYAALVRAVEKRRPTELGLRQAPGELALGAMLGFFFIVAIVALLWSLGLYRVRPGHWKHWYDFFLFNAYVSGLLEELAFRAILLRITARMVGPIGGLLISSVAFGAAHAGHAPLAAVVQIALNAGLIMGLLYMTSGRLWLSIGMHIGLDFTEWSILGVGDKSGLFAISPAAGHSVWLTGGSFGPDGSVFAGIIGVLLIIGILVANAPASRSLTLQRADWT